MTELLSTILFYVISPFLLGLLLARTPRIIHKIKRKWANYKLIQKQKKCNHHWVVWARGSHCVCMHCKLKASFIGEFTLIEDLIDEKEKAKPKIVTYQEVLDRGILSEEELQKAMLTGRLRARYIHKGELRETCVYRDETGELKIKLRD